MWSEADFRQLVSGRQRGVAATLLRGWLRIAELLYRAATVWRNRRYDSQRAAIYRPPVPVVSVGNLTLGGTGKTPMVAFLARWFRQRGAAVAIVSRGYRAREGGRNDEALELQQQLPDIPHLQNPDRVAAVQSAVEQLNAKLIVLDDGFQHRRVARSLDIVLLDALEPFGYGHLFPRGLLREGLSSLARADVVGLSRADLVDSAARAAIRKEAERWSSALWIELAHRPLHWLSASGSSQALDSLRATPVVAFCGIGNPEAFRQTLDRVGVELLEFYAFSDHHRYYPSQLDQLASQAQRLGAAAMVCTSKDLPKIATDQWRDVPLWALQIELAVLHGLEQFESKLFELRVES